MPPNWIFPAMIGPENRKQVSGNPYRKIGGAQDLTAQHRVHSRGDAFGG
jgi:hypothetical protein